mmetsp:Transcript_4200/g.6194  ORF Transcript_4200/g.6194 Transcript_4200/m.6194 type:complete len:331 (+) Transcript_4200:129-1121(+)
MYRNNNMDQEPLIKSTRQRDVVQSNKKRYNNQYEGIIDWYTTNLYRWKKQAKIQKKRKEYQGSTTAMMMSDHEENYKYEGMKQAIEQSRIDYFNTEAKRKNRIEKAIENMEREQQQATIELMQEQMGDDFLCTRGKEEEIMENDDEMEHFYYDKQDGSSCKRMKHLSTKRYKQIGIKCELTEKLREEEEEQQRLRQEQQHEYNAVEGILMSRGTRKREYQTRDFGYRPCYEEPCCTEGRQHKKRCVSYSGICALCGLLKTTMSMVYPCYHLACEACLRHHVDFVSNMCPVCTIEENNEVKIKCILYDRNVNDGSFAKVHWVKQPGKRYLS